jgi:solute carrier family 25 carnitine/acylcarnitine transporter 20/29
MMLDDAFAGFVAGVVGTLLGYPLDTIKVHQQSVATQLGPRLAMGAAAAAIYKRAGFGGFYAGVIVPLCGITALNTLSFSLYSHFRASLGLPRVRDAPLPLDIRIPLAGALIGPFATVISTPMDLVKIQMQQSAHARTLDAVRAILRAGGPASLYIGWRVNVLRETVFATGYFSAYEYSRERVLADAPPSLAVPLAGATGGVFGWLTSLPFDTVKSVQQSASLSAVNAPSASAIAARIYLVHGPGGFFRGAGASMLRAMLVSGTRFSAYETALGAVRNWRHGRHGAAAPARGDA